MQKLCPHGVETGRVNISRQMGHRNCSSDNRLLLEAISGKKKTYTLKTHSRPQQGLFSSCSGSFTTSHHLHQQMEFAQLSYPVNFSSNQTNFRLHSHQMALCVSLRADRCIKCISLYIKHLHNHLGHVPAFPGILSISGIL